MDEFIDINHYFMENQKAYCTVEKTSGIPFISIIARTLPEAWEAAVLAVHDHGIEIPTQYDAKDDNGNITDKRSKDAGLKITVAEPFGEPRISTRFPGSPNDLEVYRQEVIHGIHDHWIKTDAKSKSWTYTYHKRLTKYLPGKYYNGLLMPLSLSFPGQDTAQIMPINQLDYIVNCLSGSWYSRRAQATTWSPLQDPATDDPPCLQRIWARISEEECPKGKKYVLSMNTEWRSRDLYKAWFMNAFALTELMKDLANRISKKTGKDIVIGRYQDISDSLHIYGKDMETKHTDLTEKKLHQMRTSPTSQRAWDTMDERVQESFEEARKMLAANPDFQYKS